MKKYLIFFAVLTGIILLSGCGRKSNPNIAKSLENKQTERIVIQNNRYAGRYTIIDKGNIDRFTNNLLKAQDVSKSMKLEPDFVFDLYDGTKKLATFKYIAGIDDDTTGNLIDESGKFYHVSTSIEDEFMKRLMKDSGDENIPEYYISVISLLIDKTNVPENATVVVDIMKDYSITRYLTSIEQKRIFDSIDKKDIKIKFPTETDKWDYYIKLNTAQFSDTSCTATASVTDKKNVVTKYELNGTFNKEWNYHIKYR